MLFYILVNVSFVIEVDSNTVEDEWLIYVEATNLEAFGDFINEFFNLVPGWYQL